MDDVATLGYGVLFILLYLIINGLFSLIPMSLAKKNGRSGCGWFVFSFFFGFLLTLIVVALLGESEEHKKQRIIEEEKLRQEIREQNQSDSEPLITH